MSHVPNRINEHLKQTKTHPDVKHIIKRLEDISNGYETSLNEATKMYFKLLNDKTLNKKVEQII